MLEAARAVVKRVVLYLRRSTDRQEQSLEDQRKVCLAHAAARGWEVVGCFVDDAVSGTTVSRRHGFKEMMQEALSGNAGFDTILVYDIKRFSRGDNVEAGHWLYLLREEGIHVEYATENLNGSDSDDLIRSVKQWQARQDTKDTSRHTFRGLLTRAEGGWWNGGVPPHGYDLEYVDSRSRPYLRVRFNCDGSKDVIDLATGRSRLLTRGERLLVSKQDRSRLVLSAAERVTLVEQAFGMYENRSMGFRAIAEALNRQGVLSPKGKRWTTGAVRSIIENPLYTGRMVYNRRASGKFHRIRGGVAVRRDDLEFEKFEHCSQEDWIVVENAHPAIIDDAAFTRAQESMRERSRQHGGAPFRSGRAKDSPYLLSGLLHCRHCGHKYHGRATAKGKLRQDGTRAKTYYYACNSYINGKRAECPGSAFRRDPLESDVLARVKLRVDWILVNGGGLKLRAMIAKELSAGQPDIDAETAAVNKDLQEVKNKIDTLLESLTPINKGFVDTKLVELAQRKETLEARLRELESMRLEEVDGDALADQILATVKRFEDLFERGTMEEKKEFIGLFVEKIELDPEKKVGKVYMKRLPVPNGTKESFSMVAGAGFEPATFGL